MSKQKQEVKRKLQVAWKRDEISSFIDEVNAQKNALEELGMELEYLECRRS